MTRTVNARRRLLKAAFATPTISFTAPFLGTLASIGAANASTQDGYKAIVCIFLEGGNDHWNTIVPFDNSSYEKYATVRCGTSDPRGAGLYRGIGLLREQLQELKPRPDSPDQGDFKFALHPSLSNIAKMFAAGRASVTLNMGPLVTGNTTQQQFRNNVNVPPRLFSHNDQQALTQTIVGTEGARSGWGGRAIETVGTHPLSCIAVGGTSQSVFLSGASAVSAFSVNPDGAPELPAFTQGEAACYSRLMDAARYSSPLMKDLCLINKRAYDAHAILSRQIESGSSAVDGYFRGVDGTDEDGPNSLGRQLRMVARLIHQNSTSTDNTTPRRQVFLVGLGGFDHHDRLATHHGSLLEQVDTAVSMFFSALEDINAAHRVTAFTASDFGRTLWSNGDGSDHGWGAHHFVFSGDRNFLGGHLTGSAPDITKWDRNSEAGKGRLIPTTSLEQFAYPIARWFGAETGSDIKHLFPNHAAFDMNRIRLFATSRMTPFPARTTP